MAFSWVMSGRTHFVVSVNLPDNQASLECGWQFLEDEGYHSISNLYIEPKLGVNGGSSLPDAGHGIWISDGEASSEAHQLSPTKGPAIAAFLQQCINREDVVCVFQIPRNSGYASHADPWAFRVADCALVTSTKSFLLPSQEVVAHTGSVTTIKDVARALDASVGAVGSPRTLCKETIEPLEFELQRRLSFSWLSAEPIRPRRLCFLLWSRIAAKRASWASAKALGIKVVVISSGPWSRDDKPPHEYLLDGYIGIDMTPDAGLWRRIVDAVEAYPDPIDAVYGPWDPYMVSTAKAARHLGFFTPGPEPLSIATNKYLTRKTLDPGEKDFFTVESLEELESRLETGIPIAFPIVCKPVDGMSSWGVYRADNVSQLREAISKSLLVSRESTDLRVLIEPYVDGPEVDCNIALLDGRVLYSEVVDDFPCDADLAEDPTNALFTESQVAVPSKLPESEKKAITDAVVAGVRQQGFETGVFHCEARIRNSSMRYVFAEGATVPDLEPVENPAGAEQKSVYIHEVNARAPGPMSAGSSMVSRGIDFGALILLCAVGDWSRYEALAVPFLRDDVCDHAWLINCIVPISLERIKPLFPDHPADQLQHQAVDSRYSPLLELAKTHPDLTKHVVRHNTYIEPASRLGGLPGDWLWTTCMVLRSSVSRQHALQVAQSFPAIYEQFVKARYG